MESTMAAVLRESGAYGGMLYVPLPGEDALWLAIVAGSPREFAAPWRRVALTDPMPVADAVRERRLVWVCGQEEMARRYPRPALVLPYDFALAAAPITSGDRSRGGLVLLWSGAHPPELSRAERDAVEAGCHRLAVLLQQAEDRGDPLLPTGRPRTVLQPAGRAVPPGEAAAHTAFIDRLPGGSCALDTNGRLTFVTPAAADLLGRAADDLVGALPWEALPWMDVPQVEDRYRAALVSRRPQTFTVLRPPDVGLFFELYPDASGISVRITGIDLSGDPSGDADASSPAIPAAGPSRAVLLYNLMHLAATLTEAVGVQDVADLAADQLLPALGAHGMVLMTSEEGRLRIVGHRGYRSEVLDRVDAVPLSLDIPGTRVMTSGVPAFFASFDELRRAYPGIAREDGMAAWAFLPMIASGHPIGCMLVAYQGPRLFPPGERAVLTSLAGLVGQALDRARLYDTKHDLAHRLQSALLPRTLPRLPGLNVVARYLPAARGLEIGGDFYDLIRLDEHTAGATIGDVQGHDVDAAALMGQVRTAVHAHATGGSAPIRSWPTPTACSPTSNRDCSPAASTSTSTSPPVAPARPPPAIRRPC
ncbi:SpoIIE family protein phosphatase [Streptomyces sp. KM77-8]|uniref:SpoIIE family protein phosphatase n=1 Tax=Streptomyces haneummycinicus TaxID=3074435 RepID=A0AAT9HL22_9ACTN